MGRTPKPLKILAHPSMEGWPEVKALQEQGHTFVFSIPTCQTSTPPCPDGTLVTLADFDAVWGPNCWRLTPDLREYLDDAKTATWAVKYPPKEK